jgi:uncharacterized protein YigA (DUF484 family)
VAVRLWGLSGDGTDFGDVSDAAKAAASTLELPLCGSAADQAVRDWFDPATDLRSMAQVPLREATGACFGLLVMASEDPYRFYPELGTLYLERIGEIAAAAYLRVNQ